MRVIKIVRDLKAIPQKVIRCYNNKGEGHYAKKCTTKKRVKDSKWFKDKMLLAQKHEVRLELDDEEQDFMADGLDGFDSDFLRSVKDMDVYSGFSCMFIDKTVEWRGTRLVRPVYLTVNVLPQIASLFHRASLAAAIYTPSGSELATYEYITDRKFLRLERHTSLKLKASLVWVGASSNVQSPKTSSNSTRPSNVIRPSNSGNRRPNGGSALICEKCRFNGHTIDRCFKIIGYPANFRKKMHLSYTDKFLVSVIDISKLRIKVSHPNGTEALITKVENMLLTKYLTLYDVLVGLEYCVNLMSIHKVARDNKFIVAFDESHCYVLPRDLREMKCLGLVNKKMVYTTLMKLKGLNHVNFFDKINVVDAGVPYDDNNDNASSQSDGDNHPRHSSPTIDHDEDDLGASSCPMGVEQVYQPLRRSNRVTTLPRRYNDYVMAYKVDAMNKEMDALYENNTQEITELPSDRNAIGCKSVFKIKYKSNGEIERYKARLVAKGFNEKEGIDFDETFSSIVKIVTA
uniref:Ribonuclease H-like domain-containing protein n=1 Tax=Tanacetum cinerariifolium TaxID=118510 RepID=A0A6L2KE13_TANCI|nr:ribonuclease H-like domain-containing protein [Tanacetum cinerariifolium]